MISIENKVATTVNAKYLNYKKKSAFRKYMQLTIYGSGSPSALKMKVNL